MKFADSWFFCDDDDDGGAYCHFSMAHSGRPGIAFSNEIVDGQARNQIQMVMSERNFIAFKNSVLGAYEQYRREKHGTL